MKRRRWEPTNLPPRQESVKFRVSHWTPTLTVVHGKCVGTCVGANRKLPKRGGQCSHIKVVWSLHCFLKLLPTSTALCQKTSPSWRVPLGSSFPFISRWNKCWNFNGYPITVFVCVSSNQHTWSLYSWGNSTFPLEIVQVVYLPYFSVSLNWKAQGCGISLPVVQQTSSPPRFVYASLTYFRSLTDDWLKTMDYLPNGAFSYWRFAFFLSFLIHQSSTGKCYTKTLLNTISNHLLIVQPMWNKSTLWSLVLLTSSSVSTFPSLSESILTLKWFSSPIVFRCMGFSRLFLYTLSLPLLTLPNTLSLTPFRLCTLFVS